jgi:hypothetical protein
MSYNESIEFTKEESRTPGFSTKFGMWLLYLGLIDTTLVKILILVDQ